MRMSVVTDSFFPVSMCPDCDTSIYFVSLICAQTIPPLALFLLCLPKKAKEGGGGGGHCIPHLSIRTLIVPLFSTA